MSRVVKFADLFCGAGGTSTGAIRAIHRAGLGLDALAVNHWPTAVKTHELNHPSVRHLCADLNALDPLKVSGKLDLFAASPECTHHSNARGGKPCDDQSRSSAWHVLHWVDKTKPERIFLENVREWKDWGPLNSRNRPIKSRKGELFKQFIGSIGSLGYRIEWRIQNAADFGDATSRVRLIAMAVRGNKPIIWPKQTHTDKPFNGMKKWRAAKEVIDWDLKGTSIFERKRPLKPNTIRRIMAGMKRFNGPFLVKLYGTSTTADLNSPMPTVTSGGNHLALCQPFLIGQQSCAAPRSTECPVPTIATRGAIALVEPFLIQMDHTKSDDNHYVHLTSKPVPTITTADAWGVVEPFLVKYYGNGDNCCSVDEPLATITTRDRFLLVMPDGSKAKLDIRFRMLQPHELSAAMGFPSDYQFHGNREERVKQIGNAVPVHMSEAHCFALINN
jgi:DNA (cytosine-5)-methyltransferase 1